MVKYQISRKIRLLIAALFHADGCMIGLTGLYDKSS